MRVAAGVILILVAIIDLFAGLGYLAGGAAAANPDKVASLVEQEMKQENKTLTPDQQNAFAKFKAQDKSKLEKQGNQIMFFGVFLLISVGTSITAIVFLFKQKHPTFIIVAGAIVMLCEVIGSVINKFGMAKVFGLVGGAFAIIAALQMINANRTPPAENVAG